MLLRNIRSSLVIIVLMTILTGIIYPGIVTALAKVIFPVKAAGSILIKNGKKIGSELIGQQFDNPKYFWSRLSATSPYAYNASASSGSNYGPLNQMLQKATKKRIADLQHEDTTNAEPVPIDLVTSSSSGLDPHISVAAARYQAERVAHSRGMKTEQIQLLIQRNSEGRTFGILGEPRVNVLKLNYALDEYQNIIK
jgi:K+-transporting ATPase ATPase C chain